MAYGRFAAMIVTSTVVMYGLMHLNTWSFEHVYFSQTRMWMSFYMGAVMAIIMLAFMLGMYRNRRVNVAIFGGAAIAFALSLFLVRSQETVGDVAWMKAMIPHHSIAIMTSERAQISDPRVRKLADEIISAQNREISEMRWLIDEIAENGTAAGSGGEDVPAEIAPLADALATPVIATLDLAPMSGTELDRAVPGDGICEFRRQRDADPIFAIAPDRSATTKLSGQLIALNAAAPPGAEGATAGTDGMRLSVEAGEGEGKDATLRFELRTDPALSVGYKGYWTCDA